MAAHDASTSLQRTYRYLRIAIAGAVVVVFAAILVTLPAVGLLPSISHYYYTPARTMFVGALVSVSVAFFALSGRGAERVLLDLAATVVPLVAIVPTMISPGSVPGVETDCAAGVLTCVPTAFAADVGSGVLTYLIVGLLVLVLAGVLLAAGEVERRGTLVSIALSAPVLLAAGLGWWLARDAFLRWAHLIAAVVFFGLIAAVALYNAFRPGDPGAPRWLRGAYTAIGVALGGVVVGMPVYGPLHVGAVFGVFVGEVLALALFAAFWILQSVQYWGADDPAFRARE